MRHIDNLQMREALEMANHQGATTAEEKTTKKKGTVVSVKADKTGKTYAFFLKIRKSMSLSGQNRISKSVR
jgi:hypothetical protein